MKKKRGVNTGLTLKEMVLSEDDVQIAQVVEVRSLYKAIFANDKHISYTDKTSTKLFHRILTLTRELNVTPYEYLIAIQNGRGSNLTIRDVIDDKSVTYFKEYLSKKYSKTIPVLEYMWERINDPHIAVGMSCFPNWFCLCKLYDLLSPEDRLKWARIARVELRSNEFLIKEIETAYPLVCKLLLAEA